MLKVHCNCLQPFGLLVLTEDPVMTSDGVQFFFISLFRKGSSAAVPTFSQKGVLHII